MSRQASTCKTEISRLLSKAGFSSKLHDEIIEYVIDGPAPSLMMAALSLEAESIEPEEETPKKRFENIVHERNELAGREILWRKVVGRIIDIAPLNSEEVQKAKKKGCYDPRKPYRYMISLRRGGRNEIVPMIPGVDNFELIVKTKALV